MQSWNKQSLNQLCQESNLYDIVNEEQKWTLQYIFDRIMYQHNWKSGLCGLLTLYFRVLFCANVCVRSTTKCKFIINHKPIRQIARLTTKWVKLVKRLKFIFKI